MLGRRGRAALQRRARWAGALGLRHGCDGGWHDPRTRAGMLFYIPPGPPGHDSWVVGDAPYVSLHFLGADHYAKQVVIGELRLSAGKIPSASINC